MSNPNECTVKVWKDGTKEWFRNEERHRDDGPAIQYPDGTEYWFLDGKLLSHFQWKQEVAELNPSSYNVKVVEIEEDKYGHVECV